MNLNIFSQTKLIALQVDCLYDIVQSVDYFRERKRPKNGLLVILWCENNRMMHNQLLARTPCVVNHHCLSLSFITLFVCVQLTIALFVATEYNYRTILK